MKIIVLILLMLASSNSFSCPGKILNVSFLGGYRYVDGYGDLSLNKSVIENQVSALTKKYGDCIKFNVVYIPEVETAPTNEIIKKLVKNKFEIVKSIYQGDLFSDAGEAMFEKNGEIKAGSYFDKKTNINHYTLDEYILKKGKGSDVDLQLMVSDVTKSLSDKRYHISDDLLKIGHTVSFLEHDGIKEPGDFVHLAQSELDSQLHNNLNVKVNTGAGSTGLFLTRDSDSFSQKEVIDFIQKGSVDEQYFSVKAGSQNANSILKSNPIIVPSYLNSPEDALKAKNVANHTMMLSFSHSLDNPGQRYVLFSNQFESFSKPEALKVFTANFLSDVKDKAEREKLIQQFTDFLDNKVLVLSKGKSGIPPQMFKSIFSPKNGAKFAVASGFSSYQDIVSDGGIPMFMPRSYHRKQVRGLEELISNTSEEVGLRFDDDFILKGQSMGTDSFSGSKSYRKFSAQYDVYEPTFEKISENWKKTQNANDIIEDTITSFYDAKKASLSGNIGSDVLETSIFEAHSSNNKFIKHLGHFTSEDKPQVVDEGVKKSVKNLKDPFYTFCLKRNLNIILGR